MNSVGKWNAGPPADSQSLVDKAVEEELRFCQARCLWTCAWACCLWACCSLAYC